MNLNHLAKTILRLNLPGWLLQPTPFLADLFLIYLAHGTNLAFSVFANLVLPISSTKSDFANYRMLILYANYAGFFHLGLLNGLYLESLGKSITSVKWDVLKSTKKILVLMQLLGLPVLMVVLLWLTPSEISHSIIFVTVIGWGLANLITFYSYLLQATRQLKSYASVTIVARFVGMALLVYYILTKTLSTFTLIVIFLVPLLTAAGLYEIYWLQVKKGRKQEHKNLDATSLAIVKSMWRRGIILYFANISISTLFTVAGLWISLSYTTSEFADFAFAYGFASIAYTAIDGFAIVLAPRLAINYHSGTQGDRAQYENLVLIWIAPAAYWIAKVLIESIYDQYLPALPMVCLIMATLPFTFIIRGRLVPTASASGNERLLLQYGMISLALVTCFVAASSYLTHTPYGIIAGWSLAIGFSGIFGVLSVSRRLPQPRAFSDNWLVANAVMASLTLFILANTLCGNAPVALYLTAAAIAIWIGWRIDRASSLFPLKGN